MRLTAAQEERYARHLLLDGLGGEGQERLLAARVQVKGSGAAAGWAARYLAASGVGSLVLERREWADECRALSPDVRVEISAGGAGSGRVEGTVPKTIDVAVDDEAGGPAEAALRGAWAALAAIRDVAGRP